MLFTALLVIIVAFLPSILYMIWVRNTEKYEREPWGMVIATFLRAAIFGVILAIILEMFIMYFYIQAEDGMRSYEIIANNYDNISLLFLAVIIAPIVEEFTKALAVFKAKRQINEVEDGIVYGATAGFGFAATENLVYEVTALITGGIPAWIAVSLIRSISSALLHGSATAMTGYAYSQKRLTGKGSVWHGYGIAVLMHASFNMLAAIPILYSGDNTMFYIIPLCIAVSFAILAFKYIRSKIKYYDIQGAKGMPPAPPL